MSGWCPECLRFSRPDCGHTSTESWAYSDDSERADVNAGSDYEITAGDIFLLQGGLSHYQGKVGGTNGK